MVRVSLRQEALGFRHRTSLPAITSPEVNAVIFLRVIEPQGRRAFELRLPDFAVADDVTIGPGRTGTDELLAHRDKINLRLQGILDTHTSPWGGR
jgi:hypothetical protein